MIGWTPSRADCVGFVVGMALVCVVAIAGPARAGGLLAPQRHDFMVDGPRLDLPWSQRGLFNLNGLTSQQSPDGFAQDVYVVPLRPGKNLVRYFDFQWLDFDYLDDDGSAGIRLYYYDREYKVARTAAGFVRQTWAYLSDRFQYKPSAKVPYILYNSYREFLQTNVFSVEEGTLGVTSPQDLRMTLPYFGDRELFLHTSTHEMVHQFMIQKVADRAASAGVENPIGAFPLWFTEGLAEYYAYNQGIDAETDMFLRDLVLNQNGEIGYDIPAFLEDRPYSFLYTYKYGQARVAFLAEIYGERVIQAVLDQSPRMTANTRRGDQREGFLQLLARIAGEQPQQIDARWKAWLRKRTFGAYLGAKQDLQDTTDLKLPDELDWMVTTPDGQTIFYRGVERESGRAKLMLIDRRDPSSAKQLAIDQHPGTESLHPVLRSVMAVNENAVAWFAQAGEADVLHIRPLVRKAYLDRDSRRPVVDLNLGKERVIDIHRDGLIEAGDPAFSPDGKQLAFYGLDREGKIDIYILDLNKPDAHPMRITDDLYSERDLSWSEDGIVYAGDATESGHYNIFRIDPTTGVRERLTDAPVNQRFPVALAGGAVVFASDAGGKSDLWFLQHGKMHRITDFSTAITHPALSPNGLYGVSFYGARFRLLEFQSPELLLLDEQEARPPGSDLSQPIAFPDEPIPDKLPPYNPLAITRNWRLDGAQALIGGAGVGFAPVGQGAIGFSDVLRDRSLIVQFAVYGDFALTDALAFYVDRSQRLVWGVGAFRTFQQGRDDRFPGASRCGALPDPVSGVGPACDVYYLQTQYGLQGLLSYPISLYSRLDGTLRLQGVSRSLIGAGIVDINGYPTSISTVEIAPIEGRDPNAEISLDYGWDTTRFGQGGAVGGTSATFELGAGVLPGRGSDALYWWTQLDGIQTVKLIGRSKITGRAAVGYGQGSRFGRHFFLSSFDNLRGYRFNDNRLLGDAYYVAQAELAIPLDIFVRFAFFQNITGIAGIDFGGVVNSGTAQHDHPSYSLVHAAATEAWANRSMDWVLGANLGLGPFELRLQFARGIAIGGILPETDSSGSPTWVPNISLHYLY